MSLAFSQASVLKPELRLAQAISEFEADLSDEQKKQFRRDKLQTPHSDDVMRLTAEINRSMLLKGSRHCCGTRLTNFLQGVQQFASIGDILIGGSQFLPACGVWTLVRFSLMSIVQHISYMDSISLMFMEIGRSAPSYQRMALLYPRSRHLQANVLEYFIRVVQLCHRMLKLSKKSGLSQIFNGVNVASSAEQKDLERWSLAIKDEMNIAMAQADQDEIQESSTFRFQLRKDVDQGRLHREQFMRLQILDTISAYDYQTSWKQLRKVGNTTILAKNSLYLSWKSGASASTLVLSGKLGAGKSIVLANMVDDLFLNPSIHGDLVAYFFCCYDTPASLSARTIIGAIARQLLRDVDVSALPSHLISDYYTIDDITSIMSQVRIYSSNIYVVLDGIHECDRSNQLQIFAFLTKMQALTCISTRTQQLLDDLTLAGGVSPDQLVYLPMPQENPDIVIYIEQELESLLTSNKISVRDPHVVLEIRDQLSAKSEGMFLWVYLQVLLICLETSDHGIRQALKNLPLPKDLAATYTRLLNSKTAIIKDSIRTRFLSLIVAAFRPLNMKELEESLSVVVGDTSWDESRFSHDMTKVFSACCGLLVLDEEEETEIRPRQRL